MRGLETFVEQVLALLVAELVADIAGLAQPLAVAIGQLAWLLQLLAIGHDDAVIMLCVLQIVLAEHRVARRLGIARKREIFLGDVRGCAPDLHIRSVGFEATR